MRTTITLDDDTAELVRERMERSGALFRDVVNDALRAALSPARRPAYAVPTFDMGPPRVDLDRANALAADLEDAEVVSEVERGQ